MAFKNEHSADTGIIGHNTQNDDKHTKKHNTVKWKDEEHEVHQTNPVKTRLENNFNIKHKIYKIYT